MGTEKRRSFGLITDDGIQFSATFSGDKLPSKEDIAAVKELVSLVAKDLDTPDSQKKICADCGIPFLTKEQQANASDAWFNSGTCCVCLKAKSVTAARNYNYPPSKIKIDDQS